MADGSDLAIKYPIGQVVKFRLLWYFILVSCIVSFIGAYTTVELLHRRRKAYRWLQRLFCSISFGLVAIWCMHFVGNRAIVLGGGEPEIQLYYSPAFTAISVFLPIIVLFTAFTVAESFNQTTVTAYAALVVTGFLSGAAITGMHYVGNVGTSNYHLTFKSPSIVGALIIAISACLVAFTLFFRWKEHWINNWWRRFLISYVLMTAVSGMHWTAASGTVYELKEYYEGSPNNRNINMIVAIVASLVACAVCFSIGWRIRRRQRELADRAQHVVLAAATFDHEGRLLVLPEGSLPCQKITKQYNQRSFNEEFNTAHYVFQWLFRVSHNWSGVADLVPIMREHLRATGNLKLPSYPATARSNSSDETRDDDEKYSATFREQFCVAASELAHQLGTDLQGLGVLYEEIMMTATLRSGPYVEHSRFISAAKPADVEAGLVNPILFGKGQLLFVTREVDKLEVSRLISEGYLFAQVEQVSEHLARSMQIKRDDIISTLNRLRKYGRPEPETQDPGTYLACFIIQPVMRTGWNVLVQKENSKNLPMIRLWPSELEPWQLKIMEKLDGLTVSECIDQLSKSIVARSVEEGQFIGQTRLKILQLKKEVRDNFFRSSVFCARPIKMEAAFPAGNEYGQPCVMAFCNIQDLHNTSVKSDDLKYVPFSFFKCQQRILPGSPDHSILARRNHIEFGSIVAGQKISASIQPGYQSSPVSILPSWKSSKWPFSKIPSPSEVHIRADNSSEKELVHQPSFSEDQENSNGAHPFGGIMVHEEITVDGNHKDSVQMEMKELGLRTVAGVAESEKPTYADELFKITCAKWRHP